MKKIILIALISLPYIMTAQNCDSLLVYFRTTSVMSKKECEFLDILHTAYNVLSQKSNVNDVRSCSGLLKFLASTIYQEQVEQEFKFCDFALSYAQKLLLSRDSTTAYGYYEKVYDYGFSFAGNDFYTLGNINNRQRYFDYRIAGGKGMVNSIRFNKEKLAALDPYTFVNEELSSYYEAAMKEVGLIPKYD